MAKRRNVSTAVNFLELAMRDGHARLEGAGIKQRIVYVAVNHSERYSDPEEKVRADFWSELIYRYGYEPARIGVEITVPDRTPRDAADLVVFKDDKRTRPFAVIECKPDGITDSEFNQAVEQACGNGTWAKFRADFVGVVAGQTRRFLDFSEKYGVMEREENIIADLPKQYGTPEEFRFRKGTRDDIIAVSKEVLISAIRKCHQTLWGGGRLSPPAAFGELCKIIFVKISDEQSPRRNGQPYEFQIKTHEPGRKLADRIKGLYEKQKERDPEVFADNIKIDDSTLRTIVSHFEGISLSKTDLDTKGVAFEQFMDGFFKGDFGQYFTPRELIAFSVEMLRPNNTETILDPACGSGGFLLHALDFVRKTATEYYEPDTVQHYRFWHDFAQRNLFGIEINEEIARVAKMNMIIHDDGHTNIISDDALDRTDYIRNRSGNTSFIEDSFDLILTNPPFGAKVMLSERPYLSDYFLGNKSDSSGQQFARSNQKTEVLFVERVHKFLKANTGRVAIVLPDGILTNASLQYVRDFILDNFRLLSVVSLPESAFSHFGTGVKASLLFMRRRSDGENPDENEEIFMAAPQKIGYDSTGRTCDNQLPDIAKEYVSFSNGNSEWREMSSSLYLSNNANDGARESALSDFDRCVFSIIGREDIRDDNYFTFVIRRTELDGPLNPERYRGIWRERAFSGIPMSEVCAVLMDKTAPGKDGPQEYWDLIRIDDLPNNPLEISIVRTTKGNKLTGSFFEVQQGDILFARLGPTILNKKIVLCESTIRRTVASTEFLVLRCNEGIDPWAVYAVLKTTAYRDLAYSKARGATPSRYRVNREDFLKLPFPILNERQMQQLAKFAKESRDEVKQLMNKAHRQWI